jgi:hypothetical protein
MIKYFVITMTVIRSPPTENTLANIDPNKKGSDNNNNAHKE